MFRFLILVWAMGLTLVSPKANERILVLAPSSMTDVMADIGKAFESKSKTKIVFSFAGSAQLARQLDAGAQADLFLTADKSWMDWAAERQLVNTKSIRSVAGNELVLAVRNEVENWADMKALITQERFAMADSASVPAGRYAKQALQKLGLWKQAQDQAVFSENVRVTLRRLALGEVTSAIVYATDVAIEPKVRTFFTFPKDSHEPIQYWAASPSSAQEGGVEFLKFLGTENAIDLFKRYRFLSGGADK